MFGQRWGGRGRDVASLILIGIAWFKFQADFNYGLRWGWTTAEVV